ncbi:MAG: response regulator transcription factor [Muribaculaceae bacterium]|nr:response regulator transcription factor [Muribaculaceae bacterium]
MSQSSELGNILIVDDDDNITELLQINLRSEGYSVSVVAKAEDVVREEHADTQLVIVDCMKQEYSGMDLIFDLKDDPVTEHVGIILYSQHKSERMVIDALDAGADDYVVKPFSLRELLARIKSIMRRHYRPVKASNVLSFFNLTMEPASRTVKMDGMPLALSPTEYSILAVLLKNVDTYVTRAEIHKKVWKEEAPGVNVRIVDTNISRLRKKLGNLGERIVSRTGHGYMLSSN